MSAGGVAPQPGRRPGPALTAALLLACVAGLAGRALVSPQPQPPLPTSPTSPSAPSALLRSSLPVADGRVVDGRVADAQGAGAEPGDPGSRPVSDRTAPLAPVAAPGAPQAALAPPADSAAPAAAAEAPYRFIGQTAAVEGVASAVLFGRGRVVTLEGPGPVDDEYVVEALSETHLLLRHTPSGSGRFVPLAAHAKPVVSPQDPEQSARD